MTGDPAALRALLAEVTASALGTDVLPGRPDSVTARLLRPDFARWQAHAARACGCTRPVRLRGWSTTIDARTGEVVETLRHRPPAGRHPLQALRHPPRVRLPGLRRGLPVGRLPPDRSRPARRQGRSRTRSASTRPPSSPSLPRLSVSSTPGPTAPAVPALDALGSVPAGPDETGPSARTADRCSARSCTVTVTRGPARRSASTAMTMRRRSPGTPLPRSSGPARSTRSNASCVDSRGLTAARRPGSGTPRSRSSKPAAPCTCTPWSASTAATPQTRTRSCLRRAGPPPSC